MGYGYAGMSSLWPGMFFATIVVLVLLAGLVLLVGDPRVFPSPSDTHEGERSLVARHTLDLRYAKGAIDHAEYDQRREALR